MAALVCLECTAVYSVGAEKCPQCGSAASRGDWEEPAATPPAPKPAAKKTGAAPVDTAAAAGSGD